MELQEKILSKKHPELVLYPGSLHRVLERDEKEVHSPVCVCARLKKTAYA
jgi:hypothetical protein